MDGLLWNLGLLGIVELLGEELIPALVDGMGCELSSVVGTLGNKDRAPCKLLEIFGCRFSYFSTSPTQLLHTYPVCNLEESISLNSFAAAEMKTSNTPFRFRLDKSLLLFFSLALVKDFPQLKQS